MTRYRHKPIEVDAVPVLAVFEAFERKGGWKEMPEWVRCSGLILNREKGSVIIPGARNAYTTVAFKEDWLVHGVRGEIYPCRPETFEAAYELAAQ